MTIYGASDLEIEYEYVAVAPIKAEQPIGSGIVVTYNPGDRFPGAEWGMAAHNLVEVGKAVRLAVNINPQVVDLAPIKPPHLELVEDDELVENFEVTSYPVKLTRGWFELSDGSKVRGEEAALEAQSVLDFEGSAA